MNLPLSIGFVGLGKLGFPVALAVESKGMKVWATDPDPSGRIGHDLTMGRLSYKEDGADALLPGSKIALSSLQSVVRQSDLILVPVQTPHDQRYEGTTSLPTDRKDFDYTFLIKAVTELNAEIVRLGKPKTVAIISTVLPGTIEREIKPLLSPLFKLCYNPFFIAMGSTIRDFTDPEFVLLGVDDPEAAAVMTQFYATIHGQPVFRTSIKNAELIKVCYNTYISLKIAYANTVMEISHKVGADCDQVIDAISLADRRLMSPAYLRGGMGDGGACHPRDNIAMSWLARKLGLSCDLFETAMVARQSQTEWLASLIYQKAALTKLPVVLYGESFKENSNITTGSPALLLSHILDSFEVKHTILDPFTKPAVTHLIRPAEVAFISTKHKAWQIVHFGAGSVVIDPFRYLHTNPSILQCSYIPIGKCSAQS